MKTLQPAALHKMAQRFIESLDHALYELDGVEGSVPIFRTMIDGAAVKVYVYFDDAVVGRLSNVRLVDKDGDVVAASSEIVEKPTDKGFYSAFKYRFAEVEDGRLEEAGIHV